MNKNNMEVHGALIQGYAHACLNLNIITGKRTDKYINNIDVNKWYPLSIWSNLEKLVIESYKDADNILIRVGIEMMTVWYNYGPGKEIIKRGVDFLKFQTGSNGYESVIKGDEKIIGEFKLVSIDIDNGLAAIYSTTPFNRSIESGVIIGGMLAPADLDFIDVKNDVDINKLEIEFH